MTVAAITAVHNVPGEAVLSVQVLIFFLQPCGEIMNPIYRLENRGSERLSNLSKVALIRSGTEKNSDPNLPDFRGRAFQSMRPCPSTG